MSNLWHWQRNDSDFCIVSRGGLLTCISIGRIVPPHIEELQESCAQLHKETHGPVDVCYLIQEKSRLPDMYGRRQAAEAFALLDPNLRSLTFVIDGSGFWSSAIRSVITGVLLTARVQCPTQVCSNIAQAGRFLAEVRGERGDARASEMTTWFAELLASIDHTNKKAA